MPRGKANGTDRTTLQMALVGYEVERQRIDEKIREIQSRLGQTRGSRSTNPGGASTKDGVPKKRVLSTAARKRIAAAQRKRWAEHRKKAATETKG
jgi:hypothetical protein